MAQVLIAMRNDMGGARGVAYLSSGVIRQTKRHLRTLTSEQATCAGIDVIEAASKRQVELVLRTWEDEISAAVVMEQEPGDTYCLELIEMIKRFHGEAIPIIGIAETVGCMEQMERLGVSQLIGAPLGQVDFQKLVHAMKGK